MKSSEQRPTNVLISAPMTCLTLNRLQKCLMAGRKKTRKQGIIQIWSLSRFFNISIEKYRFLIKKRYDIRLKY